MFKLFTALINTIATRMHLLIAFRDKPVEWVGYINMPESLFACRIFAFLGFARDKLLLKKPTLTIQLATLLEAILY